MVKNHPYVDGNKRMGLAPTFLFLALNGRILIASNEEMVEFAKELAATQMKWRTVARWLRVHSVRLEGISAGDPRERLVMTARTDQLVHDLVASLADLTDELVARSSRLRS